MKVKIYYRERAGDPPKLLSPMDTGENSSLLHLREWLEDLNAFKRLGPFQFWEVEDCCRIDRDFESLNFVRDCIHLISAKEASNMDWSKRPRLGSVGDSVGTEDSVHVQDIGYEPEFQDLPLPDPIPAVEELPGWTDGTPLKLKLLSKDVLGWYLRAEDKLHGDLKVQAMEDHEWSLCSWDRDGNDVVKIWCGECKNHIGGSIGEHNRNTVSNLFSNFYKSHLISAIHICSYCRQKGLKFEEHPQSGSTRSSPVEIIASDHKRMIEDGIQTLGTVNDSIDPLKYTFELLFDPKDPVLTSY